ncbi:uncharacterized protein LOC131331900 [Rhododendron vialii]|uniref:uncharacterized protein LOC131331900 n=1 Tax=Rhododendron vialii TaxID=182163 RepID=UPI00265EC68E|nr:uncharacterized protein LOC131331900 [Rhododendron vialii]
MMYNSSGCYGSNFAARVSLEQEETVFCAGWARSSSLMLPSRGSEAQHGWVLYDFNGKTGFWGLHRCMDPGLLYEVIKRIQQSQSYGPYTMASLSLWKKVLFNMSRLRGSAIAHHHAALMEDSRMLMTRTRASHARICQNVNRSVDNLAKLGCEHDENLGLT